MNSALYAILSAGCFRNLIHNVGFWKLKPPLTDVQVISSVSSWNGCVLAGVLSPNFWCFLPVLGHHARMRKLHVAEKENEVLQVANLPSNLWQDGLDERNPPKSVAMLVLLTWSWPESVENPSASVEQRLWGVKKNMHSSCKSVRDKNTTNMSTLRELTERRCDIKGSQGASH